MTLKRVNKIHLKMITLKGLWRFLKRNFPTLNPKNSLKNKKSNKNSNKN